MKRRLLIAAMFLLAGAVVNVAVAWGCAAYSPEQPARGARSPRTELSRSDVRWWQSHAPQGMTAHLPTGAEPQRLGFGKLQTRMWQSPRSDPQFVPGGAAIRVRSGWPMLGMEYARWMANVTQIGSEVAQGRLQLPRVLPGMKDTAVPLRLVPLAFVVNTIFYAAVLCLLAFGLFPLRRFIRVRRGRCPKCAYPMGESAVCTECGKALPGGREAST